MKSNLDDTYSTQKDLYDENVELLSRLKEYQAKLSDKESYIVSLNAIIDQLGDKFQFDLNLGELRNRQRKLANDTTGLERGSHDIE